MQKTKPKAKTKTFTAKGAMDAKINRGEHMRVRLGRKYKILFSALLIFLTAWQAQAQGAPQADAKAHRLLMWKASSATTTVYLLGSIHAGDKEMYPLPEVIESAFNGSKVLVVEVNIKDVDQVSSLKLVQQYGMYTDGDGLSKHLSKTTADALDAFCNKNGMPRTLLEMFKPWMAALTVEVLALQKAGEDLTLGIDLHFLNESKQPQKIEQLETADFQMTALSSGSEEEQLQLLAQTLKEADTTKERIGKMRAAFQNGDAETIQKMLEEENEPKSLYKRLLDDRNGPMADKIDGYLKGKEQIFVVVGAGHLVGDKGIVKLLQAKNYKVEGEVLGVGVYPERSEGSLRAFMQHQGVRPETFFLNVGTSHSVRGKLKNQSKKVKFLICSSLYRSDTLPGFGRGRRTIAGTRGPSR